MIRIASVEVRAEPRVALHFIRSQSACLLDIQVSKSGRAAEASFMLP